MNRLSFKVVFLVCLAILAFAGNSVLTRLALANSLIDAASFTFVRLLSGALMLLLLCHQDLGLALPKRQDAIGIMALFVYAIAFTIAYLAMNAATGALVLFATVQLTMIGIARCKGAHMSWLEYSGVFIAFIGLIWILAPNASAPPVHAAALMVIAGIAWGLYTLDGRKSASPLQKTARNFVGAAVLGLAPLLFIDNYTLKIEGVALALTSGAITSALGYAIWYKVLPSITVVIAGTSQLAVPAVAALGGVVLIGESPTFRLLIGSVIILAGIALTVFGKTSTSNTTKPQGGSVRL